MAEPEETQRSALAAQAHRAAAWPGAWLAVAIVLLSCLAGWFWAMPSLTEAREARGPDTAAAAATLAEVSPSDTAAALKTLGGSRAFVESYADDARSCDRRLAWISVRRSDPAAAGEIRLQSGAYVSPPFLLTATPLRIAIPYPAPYAAGRGTIGVLGVGGQATLALSPPWRAALGHGEASHSVIWQPVAACAPDHG